MSTTTETQVNPRVWAEQNLSPRRAEAFRAALRTLENERASEEYRQAWRDKEALMASFIHEHNAEIEQIYSESGALARGLEEQIRELQELVRQINKTAQEKVYAIQNKVYKTPEYQAQEDLTSELWKRDEEAFRPKVQALMDKYQAAQNAAK